MMMQRVLSKVMVCGVLLAFLAAAPTVWAADKPIRIATISIQKVLATSTGALAAQKKLEAEFTKHRQKLQREKRDLEALRSEIEKKTSVWSAEIKDQKEREYQRRVREFGVAQEDAKFAMQQEEKKVMEPILRVLHRVIGAVGKEKGYTLILENTMKGLRTRTGLLYADESLDISDLVSKELDAQLGNKKP